MSVRLFGHCPFFFFLGGGGLKACQDGYLEKNCPSSNGHLLDCGGGLNPCQDGLGHLCSEN